MKTALKIVTIILLTGVMVFVSCKKEKPVSYGAALPPPPPPPPPNRPPGASAGPDQTIIVPINSLNLDGSGSTDPDNNITGYAWTKISGPSSLNIVNANAVQTQVTNLMQGVYQFELKVTDAGALFSKDTVQVTVNSESPPPNSCTPGNRPLINAQLVPFATLSQVKEYMAVASAGNKILFAGGVTGYPYIQSTRVDIYDFTTQSWSTAELSQARSGMATAVLGNRIFFAGGGFQGACKVPGLIFTMFQPIAGQQQN